MMYEAIECKKRRELLANLMEPESAIILSSAKTHKKNNDLTFELRQNSTFAYFTGFIEDNAVAVLIKDKDNKISYIIFCKDKNPLTEKWDGEIIGQEAAKKDYLADDAYSIYSLNAVILYFLQFSKKIYTINDTTKNYFYSQALGKITNLGKPLVDLTTEVNKLRIIKSPYELIKLKLASYASAMAHLKLMRKCKAGLSEAYLAAIFNSELVKFGGNGLAYDTIVASGNNACTLHHPASETILQDGDLVLIDAGGEKDYYASDITRTIPVNGKFNPAQKAIYELVLQTQKSGINLVKPGASFNEISKEIIRCLVTGLIELGILQGTVADNIASQSYRKYYMHGFGHMVGLDVHDIQTSVTELEPGMLLTVEPGLYIDANDKDVDPKWRGIGVRIEDCVLVTEQGHVVITSAVPKEITEIEQYMQSAEKFKALSLYKTPTMASHSSFTETHGSSSPAVIFKPFSVM